MGIGKIVLKEIMFRKLNFSLGLISILIAVISLGIIICSLRAFDKQTEYIVSTMQAKTEKEMAVLQDEIRKTMKGLGFNIYIFPANQSLSEVYSKGYASKTMPENYVNKLANSKILSINHLLPSLTQKVKWPEYERTVLLIGIKGEVPQAHRQISRKPLINPVAFEEMIVGYELSKSLNLKKDDKIMFMGSTFKIVKCNRERGSIDDITIWLDLKKTQMLLGKEGEINAILALECNCGFTKLGVLRREITQILPGTKIIEKKSKAIVRAEAREQAAVTSVQQIRNVIEKRAMIKKYKEKIIKIIIPAILGMCMIFIAYLTFMNVNERIFEIGILRAIGIRDNTILSIFLIRAFVMGFAGVGLGFLVLFSLGLLLKNFLFSGIPPGNLLNLFEFSLITFCTPLLTVFTAWCPAFIASRKEPAKILQRY